MCAHTGVWNSAPCWQTCSAKPYIFKSQLIKTKIEIMTNNGHVGAGAAESGGGNQLKTICSSAALPQRGSSSSFCRNTRTFSANLNVFCLQPPHNLIMKRLSEIIESFRKTSLFCWTNGTPDF